MESDLGSLAFLAAIPATRLAQTNRSRLPVRQRQQRQLHPTYPNQIFSEAKELDRLVEYAEFDRDDALPEIIAQKDEFISYFMGLLSATPASHPQTYRLMHLLNLIAAFTAMYWKSRYRRLRPSQIRTKLLPPMQVPGHASYPSGHATQGHLIAYGMRLVVPAPNANLIGLAERIARNRELAGLHYPSDTDGGVRLATKIFALIEADRDPAHPGTPPAFPPPAQPQPPQVPACGEPNPKPDPTATPFMTGYAYLIGLAQGEWHAQPGP